MPRDPGQTDRLIRRLRWDELDEGWLRAFAALARDEDLAGAGLATRPGVSGDPSAALLAGAGRARAQIVARKPMTIAGLGMMRPIFAAYDPDRIQRVSRQLEVFGIHFSLKPFVWSTRNFAKRMGFDLTRSIIIGDQLFTDVIMGNWLRSYTILVDPLDKKLSFVKTVQREIELFLLRKFQVSRS